MLAVMVARENLHHPGMVQLLPDLLFAVEALKKDRIRLHIRMRNFDRHRAARAFIRGTEDGCHAAALHQILNHIVVKLVTGTQ